LGFSDTSSEFERGMIREPVSAGLARVLQNGVKLGGELEERITGSVRAAWCMIRIKRKLGIGTSTMQRVLAGSANA
jgi:hypothetical protein